MRCYQGHSESFTPDLTSVVLIETYMHNVVYSLVVVLTKKSNYDRHEISYESFWTSLK